MVDVTTPQSGSFRADRKLIATLTSNPQLIRYLENLGISTNTTIPDLFGVLLELIINTTDMANSAQSSANQASNAAANVEELVYAQPGGISAINVSAPINTTGNQNPTIGIDPATPSTPGSLSAADKTKLDTVTAGAAVASVSGTAPVVSSGGTTPAISITAATGVAAGSMSAADKAKIDLLGLSGSWTPTLTFTTPGDLNVVYTTRAGFWVRNGGIVTFNFVIVTSTFTFTTATGSLLVTGLPFNLANIAQAPGKLDWQGITKVSYTEIAAVMLAGGSTIQFIASGTGQPRSSIVNGNAVSGTQLTLSCSMSIPV